MSLSEVTARNRRLPCRLAGCGAGRAALSPHCVKHAKRVERYGHAEGRSIRRREYQGELEQAQRFIEAHDAHDAIACSLRFIAGWLDDATRKQPVAGQRDMARLAAHGATPKTILTEALAVYLFARLRPHALPDDQRLTFSYATALFRLAPLERRYGNGRYYSRGAGKIARRAVGERIRRSLSPLFVNVEQALIEQDAKREAFAHAIRRPFTTSTTTTSTPEQ